MNLAENDTQTTKRVRFGRFEFDPTTLELFTAGERVHVAMQPATVLKLLLKHPGELVTREDICRELWPDKVVDFGQSINASIRQLRRALSDEAGDAVFIETLPRLGYRFIHPLALSQPRSYRRAGLAVLAASVVAAAVVFWAKPWSNGAAVSVPQAAFEAYEKGVHLTAQQRKDAKTRGIEFLQQSVATEPAYADAWVALADAWFNFPDAPAMVIPKSQRAAQRALAIDANHASALLQLAHIRFLYDWNWAEAGSLYRRALASDPNDPDIHQAYASFLYVMGQPEQAKTHFLKVKALDPLSLLLYSDLSWYLMVEGNYDEALENCRMLAEVAPNDPRTISCPYRVHIESGNLDAAMATARQLMVIADTDNTWLDRFDRSANQAWTVVFGEWRLERLACHSSVEHLTTLNCAMVNADIGRVDDALLQLDRALAQRDLMLPFLSLYPEFRGLRERAEFRSALRKLGSTDAMIRAARIG